MTTELGAEIDILNRKLLDAYDKKPVVYMGFTEENVCKFGFTNDLKYRLETHRYQIREDFKYEHIVETVYNREVEKDIKRNLEDRIISKVYGTKNQTELIVLDDEFTIDDLHKLVLSLRESYKDKEIIAKLTSELEDLYSKKNDKEEELKELGEIIEKKEKKIVNLKGTEFACSVCQYTSYIKTDVVRHINRKRSCGEGVKEIIEIPIEITCEYCNKGFSTKAHLTDHIKKYCKKRT
jgi:hypothetical protein